MNWSWFMLFQLMSAGKVTIEFDGMTRKEVEKALHDAAIEKIDVIECIMNNDEINDAGKIELIRRELETKR